ncbi:hypothetical protein IEN85_19850 [Pelagicoccus sp. NFK12]|uniref:DUF3108 domain-containing protein n=1 Tax=Pelagicoccus enzymogenes TaxID=2773457 RepID=A0A927FCD0_9BACT|nr:hypothetical protein [Pelagicoccus enzymogenes]MBD5781765.1 hypothetical protein [Pelagicoccus enzymogenes]
MKSPLVFLCFVFLSGALFARADEPFVGRIDYAVNSAGMDMTYTIWLKGQSWRSELRSGPQLYELRMGNLETGEAYLVNEGGESYRRLGGMRRMGPGGPPPGGMKKKGEKGLDLGKALSRDEEPVTLLAFELAVEELRGPGKKLLFAWTDELGEIPFEALPRLRGFEGKEQLLALYFRRREGGIPLSIEVPKGKGKNAFSIVASKVEALELEVSFLTLPGAYKQEAGGRPMGGGMGGGRRPGGGGSRGGPGAVRLRCKEKAPLAGGALN